MVGWTGIFTLDCLSAFLSCPRLIFFFFALDLCMCVCVHEYILYRQPLLFCVCVFESVFVCQAAVLCRQVIWEVQYMPQAAG